jgi:hypothetical protein
MKRLKIMGLTLLALLALGAYTASMASAIEGVLPEKQTFTGEGGEQVLENLDKEFIKCTAVNILEGVFTADDEGTANLHFTGCTGPFGISVNSLGDPANTILEKVRFKICLIKELIFGLAIEGNSNPVHVEIPTFNKLFLVKGQLIAELEGAGLKGKHFSFKLEGKEGDQTVALKCTFLGKELKHTYELVDDSKTPDVMASQKGLFLILFEKEVEFMDA